MFLKINEFGGIYEKKYIFNIYYTYINQYCFIEKANKGIVIWMIEKDAVGVT